MSLLKPAVNSSAYLKAGILGFGGSGKTYTASEIAIGLCQHTKGIKTAFFDTETGSDYMIPKFRDAGVELLVHKGRAFKDLVDIVKECESGQVSVLIIDSISHVWRELQDSYKRRVKRNNLYMQDWGILKGQWSEFTDAYLNSRLHIIMLGRAGYEYEHEENEATGKKEMIKVGTKMKVEGEMAYEPSLLMEMEAIKNPNKKGFIHRATVLKDRSDLMNGKQIDNPRFKDLLPIINFLNIGGEHIGIDTTRSSEELFESPDRSWEEKKRKHSIALETLQEVLVLNGLDGTSKEAKENRTKLLIQFFGSSSKTYIEEKLTLFDLQMGIEKLKSHLKPVVEAPAQELSQGSASQDMNGALTETTGPVDFDKLRDKYVKTSRASDKQ